VVTEREHTGQQKTFEDHGTRTEADMTAEHPVPSRSLTIFTTPLPEPGTGITPPTTAITFLSRPWFYILIDAPKGVNKHEH
jgi:hypothetical protein